MSASDPPFRSQSNVVASARYFHVTCHGSGVSLSAPGTLTYNVQLSTSACVLLFSMGPFNFIIVSNARQWEVRLIGWATGDFVPSCDHGSISICMPRVTPDTLSSQANRPSPLPSRKRMRKGRAQSSR